MSSVSPISIYPCRWDWCRETFDTADRLARHVLDDHIQKEIPVKREEIRLELRAFDGASVSGDTIRTSFLMQENGFLDDEVKDNDIPSNNYGVRSPNNHETIENNEERELGTEHVLSLLSQTEGPASPLMEHDTLAPAPVHQSPVPPDSFRTPSPPRSSSFQALAASSTCSPDPASMAIAPSPSFAEIIASTLNNVNKNNREGVPGPSTNGQEAARRLSRPPSSNQARQTQRASSIPGKRKSVELQSDEDAQSVNGRGSHPTSTHSRPASRSRTRAPSDASNKRSSRPPREAATLPPIAEAVGPFDSQNGIHIEPQSLQVPTMSARLFRTGSLRLEPNFPSEALQNNLLTHTDAPNSQSVPQHAPQTGVEPPPEPDRPFQPQNTYMDDIDLLGSSLDPSIPAFTPAFDVQNQSQWPLATQAPYSFDSSLTFNSQ